MFRACSGYKAERGHTRLSVGFEHEQPVLALLRRPSGNRCGWCRGNRELHAPSERIARTSAAISGRHPGRADMLGATFGVFVLIIVKSVLDHRVRSLRARAVRSALSITAVVSSRPLMKGSASNSANSCHGPFGIARDRIADIAVFGDDRDTYRLEPSLTGFST